MLCHCESKTCSIFLMTGDIVFSNSFNQDFVNKLCRSYRLDIFFISLRLTRLSTIGMHHHRKKKINLLRSLASYTNSNEV